MFKEKASKKRIPVSDSGKDKSTLDAKHQQVIQTMQDDHRNVPFLNSICSEINSEIDRIENDIREMKSKNLIDTPEYDLAWSSNLELKGEKRDITSKIQKIESLKDEIDYYENTGHILLKYYDIIDNQTSSNNLSLYPAKSTKKKKNVVQKSISILEAFNIQSKESEEEKEEVIDKSILVDHYLSKVDPTYIMTNNTENLGLCEICKKPMVCIQQDGVMVCSECGFQELLLVEQNRPLLRQPNKEQSHFSYKRINHFREWCSQVQGKESTDIPEEVFEQILQEIKKERIMDTRKITYNKMREILKKIKTNKYYEHSNYIINRINNVPTPHFSPELEDKLCSMFKEIQGPFLKHCPSSRKNFLSYSYVLFKFFELLGLHEYLKYFQLLKSRSKLAMQDQIFKEICKELGWTFYPSL